ncbi:MULTISPECIES: Lrp/AsnC family transcriptional regulator [Hoyosella]|uniref:Putative transcriptional regulator, AsnC family protein n=1 Tax=Hoyosella subflava (strain DSM 45089 / JCM 17490 / NBRC 109087 / DQS3-9A1) TaxID=443218 RepID=F6EIA2_HOYSD|nr:MULTISPECIES: Lrp/AsnC family transcriptional regulator [Hoyosella]AEF41209.1 putative transcriptional regulator, AsnC family protein [Hoyosella subflava DQS3-9A1]
MSAFVKLDEVDFALIDALHEYPQAGVLETSRRIRVARATVQARLRKLEEAGVIASYEPHLDIAAAGFEVQAFAVLETAQGALEEVAEELRAVPGVLEAFATTGTGDVLCRIAAASHKGLQRTLIDIAKSPFVVRSTSLMVLSVIVPYRSLPLLHTLDPSRSTKAPAYRK